MVLLFLSIPCFVYSTFVSPQFCSFLVLLVFLRFSFLFTQLLLSIDGDKQLMKLTDADDFVTLSYLVASDRVAQSCKQKTNDNPDVVTEVNAAAAVNAPEDWTVVMKRELAKVMNQKVETGKREKNVILYRAVEKKEEARKNDVELVKKLLVFC